MSLYVGHLSPHVQQEELERVFQRFGRCNIQLKDGYAFAVYNATADAERALRALRGKPICGEQISLNWSNRQPRPFQRSARTTRFYKPFHQRSPREEPDEVGIRGSNDRRGLYAGASHPLMSNHEIHSLDNTLDKKIDQVSEDIVDIEGDKGSNLGVTNEGGVSGLDQVEHDRWDEPGMDRYNANQTVGDEFDRYEPYHGYDERDNNEIIQLDSPNQSMDRGNSKEKSRRGNSTDAIDKKFEMSKPQQACYKCGQVGHIMRTCPSLTGREIFSKFNRKREEVNYRERERQLRQLRANLWRSPDAIRDPISSKRHRWDRKEAYPEKARRSGKYRDRSAESRERCWPKLRQDSLSKKRKKLGHGATKKTTKRLRRRKSHTPSRSPQSSSQSRSQSHGAVSSSSSQSHLRPISSQSRSLSSNSRLSSYTKSVSSRSRSKSMPRSESMPVSPILSVSVERKTTPSPKSKEIDQSTKASPKENGKNATNEQLNSEKAKDICEMMDDGNPSTSFKVDHETSGEHLGYNVDDGRYLLHRFDLNEKISCSKFSNYDTVACENHGQNSDWHDALSFKVKGQTSTEHVPSQSTRLTTGEMLSALKHYGLGNPEEGQIGLTVEEYFGAARLWPWEMIYYRRLKKGPISNENYAKRLEQNREFGIVDKYIRSSSGWGEHDQRDM